MCPCWRCRQAAFQPCLHACPTCTHSLDTSDRAPCCRQLFYQELVGKAKEKAAKEEGRKAEARDDFTRLVRHAKSLKLESTWEDIKPDLEGHSAYKDVSPCMLAGEFLS